MVEEAEKRKKTKPKKLGLVIGGDRPEEGTHFCTIHVFAKQSASTHTSTFVWRVCRRVAVRGCMCEYETGNCQSMCTKQMRAGGCF